MRELAQLDDFPRIVLASGSPRRRMIFEGLGIPHECIISQVDEKSIKAVSPREFALKAAFAKAAALDDVLGEGALVVGADTIVVFEGEIFFKPVDVADAVGMLRRLSGHTHQVITGIAVHESAKATQLDAVATDVRIRVLTDGEIEDYVATGEPLDKAGSYGIQGLGGRLVERISGDYFNVVGLPVDKLLEMLGVHMDVSRFVLAKDALKPEMFRGV